ncbi:MAG: tRNA and rRNA cytosine-C5-methylase [Clostridia bacterium]|nr:tRNA and rRNA cytosine-C5-methylase [Clostridia bacterium]
MSTTLSLPKVFLNRMNSLCGFSWEEQYTFPLHRGLRVNTLKTTKEHLKPLLASWELVDTPFSPLGFSIQGEEKVGTHPLHHAGAFYMQEPSAMAAVTILDPKPGEKVLDLCAAPGGKSTQIASLLQGEGLLWCNEFVANRAVVLCQNLERLGVTNSVVTSMDTTPLCDTLEGTFDKVLVDAPCSGEGMFRKEPAALEHWSPENISLCAKRTSSILDNAAKAVRPGGKLLFSTCTFAPEENECQIAAFLMRHPEFSLLPLSPSFGRSGFSWDTVSVFTKETYTRKDNLTNCLRIFPEDGGEGHFIALLEKNKDFLVNPKPRNTLVTDKKAPLKELEQWFSPLPKGIITLVGSTWKVLPNEWEPHKKLHILSAGVPFAQICKNRLEPTHAVYMAFGKNACQKVFLSLEDPRTYAYLRGESIPCDLQKSYAAVLIEEIPIGFGKVTNGILKNHYPKGLRNLQ